MDRRVLTRNIDSDHEVGKVGTDQVQLYSKDGKLYAQLSSNDAVLVADLSIGNDATPVGAVNAYAGDTAPAGWLLCNGDAVTNGSGTVQSQTADFSDLYALLSTTYGSAGTLPDLAGRVISQENGTYARGATGGAVKNNLAEDQLPSHNHEVTSNVSCTITGDDNPWVLGCVKNGDGSGGNWSGETYKIMNHHFTSCPPEKGGDSTSTFADLVGVTVTNNAVDSASTGSGSDIENRQPTLYMNYIIKF